MIIEDPTTRKLHILNAVGRYCERIIQNPALIKGTIERLLNSAADKLQ